MIEPATSVAAPPDRGPSRRLYRLTIGALVATVLVISLTVPALRWHHTQEALARLAAAEAEADRLDPGWRLEDLEARREKVADEENAALVMLRVASLKPGNWPPARKRPNGQDWYIDGEIAQVPIGHRAPRELLDIMRGDLAMTTAAFEAARPLQRLHTGRYPVDKNGELNLDHLQSGRAASNLVLPHSVFRAHTGDMVGAAGGCRQAMAIPRSYGDDPNGLASFVRIALASVAIANLERVLALGEFSDVDLHELQQLMRREEKMTDLLRVMRGVRAVEHSLYSSPRGLRYLEGTAFAGEDDEYDAQLQLTRRLLLSDRAWLAGNNARQLALSNRGIEIANALVSQQTALFMELERESADGGGPISRLQSLLGPVAYQKFSLACNRSGAQLRCAGAALAVERYRLKHGAWPSRLEHVVPEFLAGVPVDPFTSERLTFQRTEHGVIVYSFGPGGWDDRGDVAEDFVTGRRPLDIGFRLFDPRRRGMLPLPADATPPMPPP